MRPILKDTKMTREGETDWLAGFLSRLEKDQTVAVAAEVDGRFVGQSEVAPKRGRSKHVRVLGVSLKEGYRDIGIGTELMREVANQAPRLGIEIITLGLFASNAPGLHLYEKMGYREVGRVLRGNMMDGEYIDDIMMAKEIPPGSPRGERNLLKRVDS